MKKETFLFIILFLSNYCFAQQTIVFQNPHIKKGITCILPISVTCKFKNGEKVNLKLKQVVGDSLIFEKNNFISKNYDCIYSDLNILKIHEKNEIGTYTAFGLTSTILVFSISSAIYCAANRDGEYGYVNSGFAVLWSTLTIFFSIPTAILANNFPKRLQQNKWTLNAK